MKPLKVAELANAFRATRMSNPENANDLSSQLQMFLVASGESHSMNEREIENLALSVGVPSEKLGEFKEELASWL
jgi:hypothetical protein